MKRILITPGEPAGIGPDITIQVAQQAWPAEVVAIADPDCLMQRADLLGVPLQLSVCDLAATPTAHQPGTLKILPVALKMAVTPGVLETANAKYVLETLEMAATLCKTKKADAIVTGPVNKEIINDAGIHFIGHTEFFAEHAGVHATVMLFVVDTLRVALVTTHLPLAKVPDAITDKRLRMVIKLLNKEMTKYFGIDLPRILVCGLNPHAGEGGYLGREEIETIKPTLDILRKQGLNLRGPLPADTIFTPQQLQQADVVLGMYHDQVLPLVKYLGFDRAVNMTLGLPYLRTSVDHGTALALAGKGSADAGSLVAALQLAINLSS